MKIKFMEYFFLCDVGEWVGREGVCHKVICIRSILFFFVIKIRNLPIMLGAYRLVCINNLLYRKCSH